MRKAILVFVGLVFAFVIIRAFIIIVLLLTSPEGEIHRKGLIVGHKGDWEQAITHFDQVIGLNPHHDKAYRTRAFAKTQLGDYQGAIQDSKIAIAKYPFYGESYAVLGVAEIQSGQQRNGCENLQTALDLGFEQAKEYINKYCN